MSDNRQIVKFSKRNVAGECRAMRCKEKEGLQEFDRPNAPTVLLCPGHLARALEHNDRPGKPSDAPVVRTAVDEATGDPIYSLDGGATWVFGEAGDGGYDETAHALAEANEAALAEALAASQSTGEIVEDLLPVEEAPPPPSAATTVVVEHADVAALVAPLAAEWSGMLPQLVGFAVNDQPTVDVVGTLLLQVKAKLAELEKGRKRITQPLVAAKRAVDDLFRPATSAAKEIEGLLKKALGAYTDRQQAAQVAALQAGQHEAALAVPQPTMPQGVSTVTVWKWRITNAALIPVNYLVVDSAKVQARVNMMKGACDIPGVEAYPETGVRAATK